MAVCHGVVLPEPLAYLLTWPTYGVWLPGDGRGWVRYRRGFQLPDPVLELEAAARMSENACRLCEDQRRIVETTIAEHCQMRKWRLHAVNCRSNHVHVVVTASEHPTRVRDQFKAWCTRRLRESHRQQNAAGSNDPGRLRRHWWAARGSSRFLNDTTSLEAAVGYVLNGQDKPR